MQKSEFGRDRARGQSGAGQGAEREAGRRPGARHGEKGRQPQGCVEPPLSKASDMRGFGVTRVKRTRTSEKCGYTRVICFSFPSQNRSIMSRRRTLTHALLALFAATVVVLAAAPAARADTTGVSKLVDPDTSARWEEVFGTGSGTVSTENAGRIWADKSVYASADDACAAGLPVKIDVDDHSFIVGLSTLASAVSVRQEGGPAHDVVFVVSTNRLLEDITYGGRPQADYLVDALNQAVARLMAENEGAAVPTRVAVIGYDSKVTTLMPLGTYEPDGNGHYVAYDGGTLSVTATATDGAGVTASARLDSGSYLQLAMHVAGNVLVGAANDPGSEGRVPVLCLMGRETPPMASPSFTNPPVYTGDGTGFLGPLPGSRENGYGTDALLATLLTMRNEAARVNAAWGAKRPLTFFTCGLDTSETAAYLLETAHEQAHHPLPGTGAAAGTDLRENLSAAAQTLAEASTAGEKDVTLHLFGSGPSGLVAEDVTFPCAPGLLSAADGYEITPVDDYLSARSATALSWAFGTVVDRSLGVVYTAPASGGPGDDRPGGSRVTVSDEVGPGMEVARVSGIVYGDTLLDGELAAQAVKISLEDPGHVEATHEFGYIVDAMNARYNLGYAVYDLFYDALQDGQFSYAGPGNFSNRASWYVNDAHEMIPMGGEPFAFATQAEVDAAADGRWQERAPEDVREKIEAAQAAGATAVCETYYYIGNLPNQYTGGDVTLYDFVVMVETSLTTGRQTLLLSVPVDAVPARRTSVTVAEDGSATLALDGDTDVKPLRFAYLVSPTPDTEAVLERADAGEEVSDEELEAALGADVQHAPSGARAVFASAFTGAGTDAAAGAVASAWAAQTNSYYAFSRDTPLFSRTSSGYAPLMTLPQSGQTYYFEQTVYTADVSSADDDAPAKVEKSMEPYTVALDASEIPLRFDVKDGQCVALAGTPRYVRPVALGSSEKDPNATGSAPYVDQLALSETGEGAVRLSARLGNNGALVLPDDVEEPPVVDPTPDPEPEPEPTPDPEPEPEPTPDPEPDPAPDQDHSGTSDQPSDETNPPSDTADRDDGGPLPSTGDSASELSALLASLIFGLALLGGAIIISREK